MTVSLLTLPSRGQSCRNLTSLPVSVRQQAVLIVSKMSLSKGTTVANSAFLLLVCLTVHISLCQLIIAAAVGTTAAGGGGAAGAAGAAGGAASSVAAGTASAPAPVSTATGDALNGNTYFLLQMKDQEMIKMISITKRVLDR